MGLCSSKLLLILQNTAQMALPQDTSYPRVNQTQTQSLTTSGCLASSYPLRLSLVSPPHFPDPPSQ